MAVAVRSFTDTMKFTPINRKRHTKPCVYFQTNSCPLAAEDCDFVHVIVPIDPLNPVKPPQANLRTKPCKFYTAGFCKQGIWCRFKHPANVPVIVGDKRKARWDENGDTDEARSVNDEDSSVDVRDIDKSWKVRRDLHPKYRTRPCRNFFLGNCTFGDKCSYLHDATVTRCPSTPGSRPQVVLPSSPAFVTPTPPPSACQPEFAVPTTVPEPGHPTEETVVSLPDPGNAADSSAGNHGANPTGQAEPQGAAPPVLSPTPVINFNGVAQFYHQTVPSFVVPCTPPFSPHNSGPGPIVHVPGGMAMYSPPAHVTVHPRPNPRKVPRTRSLSQCSSSSRKKSVGYKSKPCKFFTSGVPCPKGDSCTFIHEEVAVLDTASSQAPSDNASNPDTGDQTETTPTNVSNFYKVNWRVVGGGVMVSCKKGHHRRLSLPKVSHGEHKKRNVAQESLANVTCAFYPSCPHGDACSFKHAPPNTPIETVDESDDECEECELTTPPFDAPPSGLLRGNSSKSLTITVHPPVLSVTVTTHDSDASVMSVDEERLDWGDDNWDDEQPQAPPLRKKIVKCLSTPSSPVSSHMDLPPSRFLAESP